MVDAEKRLLASALKDPDNLHFVLLSERWFDVYVASLYNIYLFFPNHLDIISNIL